MSNVQVSSQVRHQAAVSSWSDTQIQATVPSLLVNEHSVVVTTSAGSSNPATFEIQSPISCQLAGLNPGSVSTTTSLDGTITTIRDTPIGSIIITIPSDLAPIPQIQAQFMPASCLTLDEAAGALDHNHFNWISWVIEAPILDPAFRNLEITPFCTGPPIISVGAYVDAHLTDGSGNLPQVPFFDPPAGGYQYQRSQGLEVDNLPWYWDEIFPGQEISLDKNVFDINHHSDPSTPDMIRFIDNPFVPSPFNLRFQTSLVGVSTGSMSEIIPNSTFEWTYTNFGQCAAGIFLAFSFNPGLVTIGSGSIGLVGFIEPADFTQPVLDLLASEGIGIGTVLPVVTFNPVGPFFVYEPALDFSAFVSPAGGTFSGPGISANKFDPGAAAVGTHTITYTFTDANNRSNSASQDITVNLPPLPHAFVLLADKKIKINGQISSDGDMHSNDKIDFKKGKPSTHTGSLTAVGDIKIDKDNTIDGDATAGGKVDLKRNAKVTGTRTENAAVAAEPLPTLSFSAGGDKVRVKKKQSLSLAPGSYGKVKVDKGGTLTLSHDGSSGDYFFDDLDLKDKTTLSIDVSNGPVTINAVKKLHFHKHSEVVINSPFGSASRFVTFNSLKKVDVHAGARVLGSIIAPDDKVHLHKNVSFQGAICAKDIDIAKDGTILHHDSGSTLPKASTPKASTPKASTSGARAEAIYYAQGTGFRCYITEYIKMVPALKQIIIIDSRYIKIH